MNIILSGILAVLLALSFPAANVSVESSPAPIADQSQTYSLRENDWSAQWDRIKDDYEDVNQEIQIYSANGDLLLSITENEKIFIFIKGLEFDKWDYSISPIPQDALKLCSYTVMEQDSKMVRKSINTVYYDDNGYYHLTEIPDMVAKTKMSKQAALYLTELAGLELTGTEKFSEHEFNLVVS